MSLRSSTFLTAVFGGWLLWIPATVRALTVAQGFLQLPEGVQSSLAVINGHPAVAWANAPSSTIKYARALDPEGTVWSPPVTIHSYPFSVPGPVYASVLCLREVNGRPAVCYIAQPFYKLTFHRALTATGTDGWMDPVVIPDNVFQGAFLRTVSMEIVNGNPAIASSMDGLVYVRATDVDGTAWGPGQLVKPVTGYVRHNSLAVVQGRPAITGCDDLGLWYVEAQDAAGDAWKPHVRLTTDPVTSSSLREVEGAPAVSWIMSSGTVAYMRRAPDGTWLAPLSPAAALAVGTADSFIPATTLAVVGGKPAIAWQASTPANLVYVSAADATGAQWHPPVSLQPNTAGQSPALVEVNGRPALTYFDPSRFSLEYVRAAPAGWLPEMLVEQPAGTAVLYGSPRYCGSVPVGDRAQLVFTLWNVNAGSADLIIEGLSIAGTDPEFSVSAPAGGHAVPAGGFTTFTTEYIPRSSGSKSALLHITTNAGSGSRPFVVRLTGDTLPAITLERPGGVRVPEYGLVDMPFTLVGGSTDFTLTVRNSGTADLNSLGVLIEGLHAPEFSVVSAPAPSVPPGGTTTFTLRLTPVVQGEKTISLRLDSSVPDGIDPFAFSVRTVGASVDDSFQAPTIVGEVLALAVRPDGKILVGTSDNILTTLHADGSPDLSFFSPALHGGPVNTIVVLPDGLFLAGGRFTAVNGRLRSGLARLKQEGTLDETFVPACPAGIECLALQRDGKILAGGNAPGPNGKAFLVRLLPDGSLDATFSVPQPDATVLCILPHPDGHLFAGGVFYQFGNSPVHRLVRLDPDGSVQNFGDIAFGTGTYCLSLQPDGKLLAGGHFGNGIRRFLPNGSPDGFAQFVEGRYAIDLALQADGACWAGFLKVFTPVADGPIARVRPDGIVEKGLIPDTVRIATRVALDAGGSVLVGGDTLLSNGALVHLARLHIGPAFTSLQTPDRQTVRWMRGGTAPEVTEALFHAKPAGASDWTPLGFATRIPGGWELSGLTLPASGLLRARARTQGRGGSSLMESVITLPSTPLEYWRMQYFHTSANTGTAADDADPDHDGLTNFTEFAFGLDPVDGASNALPEFKFANGSLTATFTAPSGPGTSVIYRARWSSSLQSGTWLDLPDTGTAPDHIFHAPATAPRLFIRWELSLP